MSTNGNGTTNGIAVKKVFTVLDRCPYGTGKLAAALAKAIPAMPPLVRNQCSHFAKKDAKGHPIPDYADLAQCHKTAAKALAEQELVVIQTVTNNTEGEMVLCTQLLHSSGEYIDSYMPIKANVASPQAVASAITYARRTAYCAIVGLAADDDDDGAGAEQAATKDAAEGSARILALAEKSMRDAPDAGRRGEVLLRVEHHKQQGTITDEQARRLVDLAKQLDEAQEKSAKQPAKADQRGQKKEPVSA